MIKNNERLYQMAFSNYFAPYKSYIMIYDLIKRKEENIIYICKNKGINKLQHYYNPSNKMHMLLCSCYDNIQIWDISSNPVKNILKIENINSGTASCLMLKDDKFFIYGCKSGNKALSCWDQNGNK